jgi:hypothetical protein
MYTPIKGIRHLELFCEEADMPAADAIYNSVRTLYSQYRTVSLNRKYYGNRLQTFRGWDRFFEITIAIGTSSAIGGWAIWHASIGSSLWAVLGALVAVLAVIKPFLQLSKQIERYTKLFIGYGDTFYDLDLLVFEIGRTQIYSNEMDKAYRKTLERLRLLAADDDPQPNQKLLRKCTAEVNKEIPMTSLWWPQAIGE